MPYSLRNIYSSFKNDVEDLNRIVLNLSSEPSSLERDTHIEGCFIRFVVCWEIFCEEYFLRCLCTAKTRSGYKIKPLITSPRNLEDAFTRINRNRRNRDKDFVDWLDSSHVNIQVDDYFRKNSRVQKLKEAPDKMYELRIIRNAIAHRSKFAINRFEKFVKDQLGYLSVLDPTMADLLIMKRRKSNKLIFIVLSEYFLGLSERLTK